MKVFGWEFRKGFYHCSSDDATSWLLKSSLFLDWSGQYIFKCLFFLSRYLTPVSYFLFCRLEITAHQPYWGSQPPRQKWPLFFMIRFTKFNFLWGKNLESIRCILNIFIVLEIFVNATCSSVILMMCDVLRIFHSLGYFTLRINSLSKTYKQNSEEVFSSYNLQCM